MYFFDTHMHFFPDHLAQRAMERLVPISGIVPSSDATQGDTEKKMAEARIFGGVVLHIATNPGQQRAVNDFAAKVQGENLLCFGSVHPDAPDVAAEVARIKALGLQGIKLHPDYQDFFVDDARAEGIYRAAVAEGLPVAFHAGRDPLSPEVVHGTPAGIAAVAKAFPDLRIIAAHMGGAYMTKDCLNHLARLENVWYDTAVMNEFLDAEAFEAMVKALGVERIFFATDLPWSSPKAIRKIIEGTCLTTEEKQKIYADNALAFFGMEGHCRDMA